MNLYQFDSIKRIRDQNIAKELHQSIFIEILIEANIWKSRVCIFI